MKLILKFYHTVIFIGLYLYKLIQSNLYIAYDLLTPHLKTHPGIIRVPLILKSDTALLLFSNLVSMTPGSLSIDITHDRKLMLVHILYLDNEQTILNEFEDMQNKIKIIADE
ncbi:Na+/H+ antiporter subunit E [Carboxylicivirga taeanensis]|uniref:Na+/H+ antiporter subunit E n=1 Tax=Carboxylicivirga taeanensis TaxID=1416875 RepID=UPI003F6E3127